MKFFVLNEIFPDKISKCEFYKTLENSLQEYKKLKDIFKDKIDGIVISSSLNIILNPNFTLAECLKNIKNIDVRNYGYSLLTKYPVDNYLQTEETLEANIEHFFRLGKVEKDAFFLKLIYDNKGICFTLNLHTDLAKNELTIFSKDNQNQYSVNNLFGEDKNTQYIKGLIEEEEKSKLGNFDKLCSILKSPKYSNKLKLAFEKESKEVQDAIIKGFEIFIENEKRGQKTTERSIKDVTPSRERRFNIKELKIKNPRAKRLYFSIKDNTYYLASLEDKPLKDRKTNEQGAHIKNAHSKLCEWMG